MKPKIAIYTVLTNYYDHPKPISVRGIDCFMFTDDPINRALGWNLIEVERTDDQRLQRKIKILGHPILDKYDITIYMDATISIMRNINLFLSLYHGGFMIGSHYRKCVYDEAVAVKEQNKAPHDVVDKQMEWYRSINFPDGFGMYHSAVMVRDRSTRNMCEVWYDTLSKHSHRDQLALPYALKQTNTKPYTFSIKDYFRTAKHKTRRKQNDNKLKIYYSTPYSLDKNIGGANNQFISLLPIDSWVCITDGDAQWMLPDWGHKIEEIIRNNSEYGLIGCMTNRLGGLHQCYNGVFSEDLNAEKAYYDAIEAWDSNGPKVIPTSGVAGVCMIFSKRTWELCRGFKENDIRADTYFNKSVKSLGLKVGLATGLYIFHSYRIWEVGRGQKKAQESIGHLL